MDTLDLRPLPGVVLKRFTARDVVSRWDVLEVHTQATATATARFHDAIQTWMPFPVRAIQVDGAPSSRRSSSAPAMSAAFASSSSLLGRPSCPHPHGGVLQVWDLTWTISQINRQLRVWEGVYNTVRPYQALGYRTPQRYLRELAQASKG